MLDPDYLEQAGERVASVYRQIESEMLDYLCGRMISGDVINQRSQTAVLLLAQSAAPTLSGFIAKHKNELSSAVKLEVNEALTRSDKDDLARIKKGMGVDMPAITTRQIASTVAGVEKILERNNLDMNTGAREAFLNQSIWAITQVNTGAMTTEKALHAAVRRLEREGIGIISYRNAKTGVQTVKNKVDVAVRRHIRTQIAQDSMRRTEQVLDNAGVELVEVSSHGGSRPSHAKWEGRIYSRHGDKVINGVKYKDFKTACNWGDIADGIGGANCRHSYAAYFPNMKRSYKPNPEHPSGVSNAEIYDLTQQQRAKERDIRATKRELRGLELLYDDTKSESDLSEVLAQKLKLRDQQEGLRKLINKNSAVLQRSARREWAGDMPKVKVSKDSLKRKEQKNIFSHILTRKQPTKQETRRESLKPVNEALYNSKINYMTRHGGVIVRNEEAEKHLDKFEADAGHIGKITFFRKKVTTSELLEEAFHFEQELRGDYNDHPLRETLREIDAQNYLLGITERYNIPKEEVLQTEKNLEYYKSILAEFNERMKINEDN